MSFYYFYFNKKVLGLNSFRVFKSFIYPTLCGIFAAYTTYLLDIELSNIFIHMAINTLFWAVIYIFLLFIIRVITYKEIKQIITELNKG